MEAVEIAELGSAQSDAVLDGERHAWGALGEELCWVEKQRHVAVLDDQGKPLALAGAVVVDVAAGDGDPFPVVGIGGVIVTRTRRGQGLALLVVEAIMRLAGQLGPDHAMLFCREELSGLYARFGFTMIDAPVCAAQPEGRISMPLRAMWAPLSDGAVWPAGGVEVIGEPF